MQNSRQTTAGPGSGDASQRWPSHLRSRPQAQRRRSRSTRQPGPRGALGQHGPLQPRRARAVAGPRSSARRTTTTATATSAMARSSPTASTCCPSSTSSGSASSASARATRRGTTPRTRASTTHRRRRRTRWSTACRSPARSRPYTKRYAKGVSGEWLDAFAFANFDVVDVPVNVKAGQHTVYWGDSLLLGGAIHGVSYSQNSLDVWKGFATPGSEAKELFRPRGGVTLQAQPLKELSVAGQWFYNWQAVRMPESGSYLTISDALNSAATRSSSEPIRSPRRFPARRRSCACGAARTSSRRRATAASLGDWGLSARWSPEWLDGTLGFYYRNTTDILPQVMATPGVIAGSAGGDLHGDRRHAVLPGGVHRQQERDDARRPARSSASSGPTTAPTATTSTSSASRCRRASAGVSVGAELSYRQNMPLNSDPVHVLPAPLVKPRPAPIATTAVPTNGTPGALGDTCHGLVNAINIAPKTPLFDTATVSGELTWMQWLKVTQNEAVFKGRDSYTGDRQGLEELRRPRDQLHADLVPGVSRRRSAGADHLEPRAVRQRRGALRRQRGRRQLERRRRRGHLPEVPASISSTPATTATIRPTPRPARWHVANGANASLSDRGWVSLTFKTTF